MRASSLQAELFPSERPYPDGLEYEEDFVDADEERALLRGIAELPLGHARYREYVAKRRIASFGSSYDFASAADEGASGSLRSLPPGGAPASVGTARREALGAAPPMPGFLLPLRDRVASWLQVPAHRFEHALVTEYRPGTSIGWHRDVPDFALVVGVSLGAACRMRFRPYPPHPGRSPDAFSVTLAPRSVYALQRDIRWRWQHSIPPTTALRCSVTFRTLARGRDGTDRRGAPPLGTRGAEGS
jgi:hypothetical protein